MNDTTIVAIACPQDLIIGYDPCSGSTYKIPGGLSQLGKSRVDATTLANWPTVHPSALKRELPVSICWSPIVACNLECPHCLDDKRLLESSSAERLRIASVLAESGVLGVDISGGEPLLLREIPVLLKRLHGPFVGVSMTTNGWLLKSRLGEVIDYVDALRISLDGPSPEIHDRLRGQGSFARVLDSIRATVDAGCPVQIHTVLMRSNAVALPSLVDLALSLGVNGITVLQLLRIGEAVTLAPDEFLTDAEAAEVVGSLHVPSAFVRLRTRSAAEGFTVVRADGHVWRNGNGSTSIEVVTSLRSSKDLHIGERRDGSA